MLRALIFISTILLSLNTVSGCGINPVCWGNKIADLGTDIANKAAEITRLDGVINTITGNLNSLCTNFDGTFGTFEVNLDIALDIINENTQSIHTAINTVNAELSSLTTNLNEIINEANNIPGMSEIITGIDTIVDTVVTNVNTLQTSLNHIVGKVDTIPGLKTVADQIKGLSGDIPSVKIVIDDIKSLADDIPKILERITLNPFGALKELDDDIEDFANVIESCFDEMTQLIDPMAAIKEVIDISVADALISNPAELFYKVLAVALYEKKSLVEYVCNEAISPIIEEAQAIFNTEISSDRRRMQSDCEQNTPSPTEEYPVTPNLSPAFNHKYTYSYDCSWNREYRSGVKWYDNTIPYTTDNSDGNVYQGHRVTRLVLNMISSILNRLIEVMDDCTTIKEFKSMVAFVGHVFDELLGWMIKIIDFHLGTADLHDGAINNVRLDAIFNDRETIIHNQFAMKMSMENKFSELEIYLNNKFTTELTQTKQIMLGISQDADNGELGVGFTMKAIKDKLDCIDDNINNSPRIIEAKTGPSFMIEKFPNEIDDHRKMLIMKMKPSNLFLYGLLSIWGYIVIMVLVLFIVWKCCRGNKTGYEFVSVAKYDYSTSDANDHNAI